MAVRDSLKKFTIGGKWIRWLIWFIVGWIVFALLWGLIQWGTSDSSDGSGTNSRWRLFSSTRWVTVSTVTFSPGHELYAQGRWHRVPLAPGRYRFQVANTTFQQSVGENAHEGYRPVPIRGIPLYHWDNHPFQGEFARNAPVPSLGVGAVVMRVEGQNHPLNTEFTLTQARTIGLGVNLLPYQAAYERNTGEITVAIQQEVAE